MSSPRLLSGWIVGWFVLAAQMAWCASPSAEEPADVSLPLRFHRVFIPAEQLHKGKWSAAYMGIEGAEFRRLLETAHAAAIGAPSSAVPHLEQVELTGQLSADDLLIGSATFRWSRPSNAASLATLDPFGLALHAATWQGQNSKSAAIGAGPDGKLGLVVEGNELHCDWSLRGERTASGAVGFRLELPNCPVARLILETPANQEIAVENAIVAKSPGGSAKTVRWTIELGGHNRVLLRVASDASSRERRPLTLLRQAQTYDFSPRGVNVDIRLTLDIHGDPIQRLALNLDPSLRLVAARYGELQVPSSATIDVESRVSHVVLQLPEPVAGTGRVLQLSAIAPLTIGKRWRLPGLQAEAVSWQEGTATLLVPESLVLEQMSFNGCRQSRAVALPGPASGESIEVQFYRPGAAIEVVLAQPRAQLKVDSGALIEVGSSEITGQCALSLSVARGQRRVVESRVSPGWSIDGVEAASSGRNVEWEVDDAALGGGRLSIKLDDLLTPQTSARLMVRGHRLLPSSPAFEARQFEMLAFDDWQSGTRLISVRAAEGSQLRWTEAADLTRLDPLELSPSQIELFPRAPNGLVFADDPVFAQSVVALDRRRPSYSADIRIDTVVQRDVLTETITLQCTPEAARLDRLLVRLSRPRAESLEWKLAGANSGQFSARKVSAAEQAQAGLPPGGETWELSLRLLRPGPFELRAVRSTAFERETPLTLAAVADAATQKGTLTVRALGPSGMTIQNRRLASVPAEMLDQDHFQTARGTFHYQPMRDDIVDEPAISIAPARPAQAESGAWAWTSRLESRYTAGSAVHWATLFVETAGRQQVSVALPEGAKLQAAWVDHQQLVVTPESSDASFPVDLPFGRRLATISLNYTTPDGLPQLATTVEPPFASLGNVPVLARTWSVWLPAGYQIADADSQFPSDSVKGLTLAERLFGGLGQNGFSGIFNPFSPLSWQQPFSAADDASVRQGAGNAFLENLGTFMTDYLSGEAESELTWGQLLALCSDAEAKSRRSLLIDTSSLAAAGLAPRTRVRFQTGESPKDRGLGMLEQAGLVVVANSSIVAVTTASGAAPYARELSAVYQPSLFALAPGALEERLSRALHGRDDRFASAPSWLAMPDTITPPWSLPEMRRQSIQELNTWSAHNWQLTPTGSPRISIVHRSAIGTLGWSLFLSAAAIAIWQRHRSPTLLVAVLCLAATAAVWAPAAYAPLASAVLLACLTVLVLRIIRMPMRRAGELPARQAHSSRARAVAMEQAVVLLVAAGLLNAGIAALADEPPSPAPPPVAAPRPTESNTVNVAQGKDQVQPPTYRVFIPVDDQQHPVGTKYYVPKELYDALYRQTAIARGQKPWLITNALYHGNLSRDPVTKQVGLSQLQLGMDVQVFQAGARIVLPIPIESVDAPAGARLEGRTIPVRSTGEGVEFLSGPLAPGRYRIDLGLQPTLQTDATSAGFDVSIPPLANAKLQLSIPPDAPTLELPAARGQIRVDRERNELTAQLGACSRLAVRWPLGIGTDSVAANLEVEEFIWMRVRPGTTILDAKFKYRVLEGQVRQIRLLTDPRLRLLPSVNVQSPIAAVHTIPGDPQRIDLELVRSGSNTVTIDLSFLLTGTSAIGNLRLPRLESSDARAAKRWLAVSVDPALEYKEQLGEDSRSVSVADFAGAWGAADARPQAAYSIPRGEPMWALATQPIEPNTLAEQSIAISLARGLCKLRFEAALSISGGYLYQLLLDAPKRLIVERLSLLEDGQERVARWSVDETGTLTVFLTVPVTGRQKLKVEGRLPAAGSGLSTVPRLSLVGVDARNMRWQIYRQPNLLAEVEAAGAVSEIETREAEVANDFGSLVGCYQSQDAKATLRVKTTPNAPRTHGVAVTTLDHDAGRWTAQLEYHLEVLEGVLDAVQFEIPPSWSEPFAVEPQARVKLVPIPGEARRQLIVYPATPVTDKYQLRIRGRVALSPGDRLRVPDIVPQRVDELDRLIVVPQQLDRQPVGWETTGLVAAQLPAEFTARQSPMVYRVVGEHSEATIRAVERNDARPRVKLADIHLAWHPDGYARGVAFFDLESPMSDSCLLELPAGGELVHVSTDDLPSSVAAVGENRWRIGLGPRQLPQHLEVVFSVSVPAAGDRWRFFAPRLPEMEVQRTLWTVHTPPEAAVSAPASNIATVAAAAQSIGRMEAITALVQLPPEIVGEHLPEEILRWYQPWNQRFLQARMDLQRQLAAAAPSETQPQEAMAARRLDEILGGVSARVAATPPNSLGTASSAASRELFGFAARDLMPRYYQVQGPSPEIELRIAQPQVAGSAARVLAGLALLAIGGSAVVVLRKGHLPRLAPWTVICGAGLLWWLLLSPSVVGLLLLAIGGVLALREQQARQPQLSAR